MIDIEVKVWQVKVARTSLLARATVTSVVIESGDSELHPVLDGQMTLIHPTNSEYLCNESVK
jgi:hypothetical protein